MFAEIAGLVLAGGQSRRFGRDKATAILGGRSLLEAALDTLGQVAARTAVSAPPTSAAARWAEACGRPIVADAPAHPSGPLAGIAAGLAWARNAGCEFLATLPCDAPLVSAAVLRRLAAAARESGGAYAVTADGPQALVAVWRRQALPEVARRLDAGEHPAVHTALAAAGARPVVFASAAEFLNITVESDLARLESLLAAGAVTGGQPPVRRL